MLEPPDLDDIALMTWDADNELRRLCGGKRFRMCIPVQPDDSDLVIGRALNAIPVLLRRIRELEAERERILPILSDIRKALGEQRIKLNLLSDIHKALDEQRIKLNLLTLIGEALAASTPAVEAEEETR